MTSNVLRRDQVRKMLDLLHEAAEIGRGREQRLHLVHGIQRIIGGVKTDHLIDAGFAPGARPQVEELFSSFAGGLDGAAEKTCLEMSRSGCRANPAYGELTRRARGELAVTRRRALVRDADWYGSEFFNSHLRACRLDDQLYSVRRLGRSRVETFGVTRGLRDPPFTDEDQNLLELFHYEVGRLDGADRRAPVDGRLTQRQSLVLQARETGAAEMGISQQTVHGHVKAIYAAYGVQSRAELLVKCLS